MILINQSLGRQQQLVTPLLCRTTCPIWTSKPTRNKHITINYNSYKTLLQYITRFFYSFNLKLKPLLAILIQSF